MAVSFTAFLAGIDAEIRTVITAMTAERSSAAGLIAVSDLHLWYCSNMDQ